MFNLTQIVNKEVPVSINGSYAEEPFSGSSTVTKTFTKTKIGFVISNDGSNSLTFKINNDIYEVKPGEVFEARFAPFTQVTVNTSVPFRAYGLGSSVTAIPTAPDTTPPTVTALPNGGTFSGTQNITLSANEPATIYYTTNGSTPTTSSSVYSSPITISSTTTLKFFARDNSGNQSAVQTVTYTLQTGTDTTPPVLTITPAGTFSTTKTITMTTNESATIYYTLDGTTPTTSSSVYSTPITLSATTTIKAFAKDSVGNQSSVQSITYTKLENQNPGTVLISDSFNRADSTSLGSTNTGQTWKQFSDLNGTVTYGIRNNEFYLSGGTNSNSIKHRKQATLTVPTNSFSLELTTNFPSDIVGSISLAIGLRHKNEYNSLYIIRDGSKRYRLAKIPEGGSVTTVMQGTTLTNVSDTVKIDHYSSGKIDLFINGTLEFTATDTMNLEDTTTIGLGLDNAQLSIDNLKITAL